MQSDKKTAFRRVFVGDFRWNQAEKAAIYKVIEGGRISEWLKVREFEKRFAAYIGTRFAVAVSSGTAALLLGLLALLYDDRFPRFRKGAKIITNPVNYVATANAIALSGFEPVFVDIDRNTFKLDVSKLKILLKNSKPGEYAAIIPVHVMGYPNDMDEIMTLADKYGLVVFEDSAQAHGTIYKDKRTGSLGLMGGFSFYVAHNIQAGEMGCLTTNDERIFKLILRLKANGRSCACLVCTRSMGICPGRKNRNFNDEEDCDPRFTHEYVGYNFKTTEFSAALGVSQLKKADWIFKKRQENVKYLNQKLDKFQDIFSLPVFDENVSYLAYPLIIKEGAEWKRSRLRMMLEEKGVENRPLFGSIPTQQPAFAHLRKFYRKTLPVADYIGRNAFYIGCHQYLNREDLDYVAAVFGEILNRI
ncbi:MAG: DegT/DnrJ/EryC1/StrS family aminotransferase [Candidatus Omnitrophota bacterium]